MTLVGRSSKGWNMAVRRHRDWNRYRVRMLISTRARCWDAVSTSSDPRGAAIRIPAGSSLGAGKRLRSCRMACAVLGNPVR